MYNHLLEHALQNIWSSPEQDYYTVIKPSKISKFNGDSLFTRVHWDQIKLPTNEQYHVYQIGNLPPSKIGLNYLEKNKWFTIGEVINKNTNIIELYTVEGITLPRFSSYFRVLNNGNFIVIIPRYGHNVDLNNTPVYLRFYKSAYLTSKKEGNELLLKYTGFKVDNIGQVNQLNGLLEGYKSNDNKGYGFGYVNGVFTTHVNSNLVKVGDWVEVVRDTSIINVVKINLNKSTQFISKLNDQRKYLLHYPGKDSRIHFKDDVEIYLTQCRLGYQYTGCYYHQNNLDDVTMVTHKDYAIPVTKINALTNNPIFDTTKDMHLVMFIRDSGYRRPLPFEHNRIHELYKLDDELVLSAMNGTLSNIPEWRADNLESSSYAKLIGYKDKKLPISLIEDALGYDAITKVVADNPILPNTNQIREFNLPQQSHGKAIILEYKNRLLHQVVYKEHTSTFHIPTDQEVDLIESYKGTVNVPLGELDSLDITYPISTSRFYKRPLLMGEPNGEWVEVGRDSEDLDLVNSKWLLDINQWGTYVRSEDTSLFNDIEIPSSRDYTEFTITGDIYKSGNVISGEVPVPFDKVYIFFNGHSLVEDIDYIIKWPKVVIFNKEYYDHSKDSQRISYLCMGVAEKGIHRVSRDKGFVYHGYLSNNNQYDLRDDKVVRVAIRGKVYNQTEVGFYEEGSIMGVDGILNGSPYAVDYPTITLDTLSDGKDIFSFRDRSRELDKRVSDFLDEYVSYPETYPNNPIPRKYNIVSPFFNRVMYDLNNDILTLRDSNDDFTLAEMEAILEPYFYLLKFDPCKIDIDLGHVAIHPHAKQSSVLVHPKHHYFLHLVNQWFLNSRVELHETLRIGVN